MGIVETIIDKETDVKEKAIALYKKYKIFKALTPGQVCEAASEFNDDVLIEKILKKTNDYRVIIILGVFVGDLDFAKIACDRALNEDLGHEYAHELASEILKFSVLEDPLWYFVSKFRKKQF